MFSILLENLFKEACQRNPCGIKNVKHDVAIISRLKRNLLQFDLVYTI